MFKKLVNVLLLTVIFSSEIAIGADKIAATEEVKAVVAEQTAVADATDTKAEVLAPVFAKEIEVKKELFSAEWFAWLGGMMVSLYTLLRLLGEGLTRVSVWTENKWDNKIAGYLSSATWFLGSLLGRFGYKLPKLVIEDMVDEKTKKDDEKKSA